MPRGPKGERRPADAIGNAIMIGRIATGEIEDLTTNGRPECRRRGAGAHGRQGAGGWESAKRRKEIARKAANSRWEA